MSESRRTIELHIVMNEDGAFVCKDDADAAAEEAENEFGEDADVRQVRLIIELLPPSQRPEPITATCQID